MWYESPLGAGYIRAKSGLVTFEAELGWLERESNVDLEINNNIRERERGKPPGYAISKFNMSCCIMFAGI